MVKICGITNGEDALAAIEGGAAALGFNFCPASPRYIAPDRAAAIIAGLPSAAWKVGVFVDESPENVLRIARQAGLDIAQLHGSESPGDYPQGIRVWKAIRVGQAFSLPTHLPAEAVLLDGPASGQVFDWERFPLETLDSRRLVTARVTKRSWRTLQRAAANFSSPHAIVNNGAGRHTSLILAGGLHAGNVREAIEQVHPWGVDACSLLESAPGRKDHFKMAKFLKAALAASS